MTPRTEQELIRFKKLKKLRAEGFLFPNDVHVTISSLDFLKKEPQAKEISERYTIAGRIIQFRRMGKASFAHILDEFGKIQMYVRQEDVGVDAYEAFKDFDIGDIIEATGYLFVTKTGEKTLHAEKIRLLTKALIPLPEKWHGLTDVEIRYRERYVDLIANPEVRDLFRTRAKIIKEIRAFFDAREYIEVETPALHYVPGGTIAKPFVTHHNTLGIDMYLRIALELPLKKLVVGGMNRVYEIGRVFRNEGMSRRKHNPEFTMLEFYQAYATFEDLMTLTEELLTQLVKNVSGNQQILFGDRTIDFTPPWPRIAMHESLYEIGGIERSFDTLSLEGVHAIAKKHHVKLTNADDWGVCLDNLWGELVEPKIINPVFITHHPYSISPLSRRNDANPELTDRFELIVTGIEVANAFSELNDAEDQRERFEIQSAKREQGIEDAHGLDEDFLRALEYGLPPTAGEGIGIDRLVMLLTNSTSIREVLLFPQMRPDSE